MTTNWLEGKVLENRHWTETLFSVRVDAPRLEFEAGQFVRIALDIGGERIARPFSFVNPPQDPVLEFYGVVVPEGPLSPPLSRLESGDSLYIARNPAGFLVLSEVPQSDTLWLLSTGTGIAPFLSILRTEAPWQRYRNVVLVHAVRFAKELAYREVVAEIAKEHGLRYVTFVSREPAPPALSGRIPAAVRDGRLEQAAGLKLAPDTSQVMLCGNPQMLKDTTAALVERGMRKHRRRIPGHITVEAFW
jgi:ferredoxin--NADP+ reductase